MVRVLRSFVFHRQDTKIMPLPLPNIKKQAYGVVKPLLHLSLVNFISVVHSRPALKSLPISDCPVVLILA